MFSLEEAFYTINLIPGIYIKGMPIALIIGCLFLLSAFFLFIRKKTKNFNPAFLSIALIFWLPLFFISFYNNFYDLFENISISQKNISEKQFIRLYNMEKTHLKNGPMREIDQFIQFVFQTIPKHSKIKIITSDFLKPYLDYFLYPQFSQNNQNADYLIFYLPNENYAFEENKLYKKNNAQKQLIAQYEKITWLKNGQLILRIIK